MSETIFIASDHAGFDLKKQILNSIKAKLIDLGVDSKDAVDYPDYAKKLVSKINLNENKKVENDCVEYVFHAFQYISGIKF